MDTKTKLSAYGAALVLIIGGAYAAGSAVGPPSSAASAEHGGMSSTQYSGHGQAHSGTVADTPRQRPSALPAGLASSSGGYTFTPTDPMLITGSAHELSFRITGPDNAAVTSFDLAHDKRLHLIVVRRDTTGFQHLHPHMDADGTWRVPLTVPTAGSYRAFADFTPTGGQPTTLGVDLAAPGDYAPSTHQPNRTAEIDGYRVELAGDLIPGQSSPVTLTVSKDAAAVTDLQPYLGAYGHLVALREGDLAYLHVHPDGAPGDGHTASGPQIQFVAEIPSAGDYRLFLDFQHNGTVRTAEFTVPTGSTSTVAPGAAPTGLEDHTAQERGAP